ncbi:MAG: PilZ domain-containing protein [Gammaproteobacteria bacterium]
MSNRRKQTRAPEKADVTVKVLSATEATELEGKVFPFHSKDISLGGLQLHVNVPVPVGARLELEITLENSPEVYRHTGNVMWDDEWSGGGDENKARHKIGVQFNTLDNLQFNAWREAIKILLDKHQGVNPNY